MADKDDAGGGAGGEPTVGGSSWAKLSEFYPYGDSPPRLSAGLNDALTDASETAVFAKTAKTKTKVTGTKTTILARGASMEAPQEDKVTDPYQAEVVHEVLDWVSRRLDLGVGGAWLSQTAQVLEWAPSGGSEEGWAQAITEMFLGVTYSGPGQTYQMGVPLKRDAAGQLVKDGAAAPEAWEPMVYRRIARRQWIHKGDRFGLQSWDNPVPFDRDGDEPNADPAIPIGTACQHLSTYAVITRGIPIDATGNMSYPAVGLMASDANWSMPLFGGPGYDRLPAGKTEKLPGFHLPSARPKPAPGEPESPPKPEETVSYYLDVKSAVAEGFGAGCIAIYDPDRGTERSPPQIYMTEYERNKYGPDEVMIYGKYFKSRASDEDTAEFTHADWNKPDRAVDEAANDIQLHEKEIRLLEAKVKRTKKDEADLALATANLATARSRSSTDVGPRQAVAYPGPRQYDGSHIYAVLRKHPTKPMVQLLDVNLSDNRSALEVTGSESIMSVQVDGIVDGCSRTKLYDLDNAFGGLGVLPPHSLDQAQVDFLRMARPVGLGRLAITRGRDPAAILTDDDVLYVSRMMRLYGDDTSKNYTVARLLWSLRNTPGFTDIRVWWFVYAPRGLLAKAMWAHGARRMRLSDFVTKYREIGADDILLAIVTTNLGAPPRAGHATFYCRYKSRPVGGRTVTEFVPKAPPSALMRYLDPGGLNKFDPARRSLAWNASYAHPKIKIDEARLPHMFQAGG